MCTMLFVGLLVFLSLTSVRSQTTIVNQCTSHAGELPINTYIAGCDTQPCMLTQLQFAELNIVLKAPHEIISMKTKVTAYLSLGPIPLPPIDYDLGEESNTCNFLQNTYCPLQKEEIVQYTLRMYIEPIFPVGVTPTLEFYVTDQDNNTIFCLRVQVRITAPLQSSRLYNSTIV